VRPWGVKRSRLSPRSTKTADRDVAYKAKREVFLYFRRRCEISWDRGCTIDAHEVHHMQGRVGERMLDERFWMPACRHCHQMATVNPAEAFDRGVSLHRNATEAGS